MLSRWLGTASYQGLLQILPQALAHVQEQLVCSPWCAAAGDVRRSPHVRAFRTTADTPQQQDRLVTAFLENVLTSLSIPHGDLDKLAASQLSDAALTAWALTKTVSHPAVQQAAAVSQQLRQLLTKLDGAVLWQQTAASSPLGQLLRQVAVGAEGSKFAALDSEQLIGILEYQVVHALVRNANSQQHAPQVLQQLVQQLHHMTDTPPMVALGHPDFWQLAKQVAAATPELGQDLSLLGYDLPGAADAAAAQLQKLQQLTGVDVAALQQQLKQNPHVQNSISQAGGLDQLLAAVAGDATARQAAAQLALLQALAQALGLTSVQFGHVAASPCELVARLTGLMPTQHDVGQQLQEQLAAAAPALLAAVGQLPAAALEQAGVGSLLQLISSKQELKELFQALTNWRAGAAASGWLPVLISLTQSEVSALSQVQAEAVGRAMMQLEARGQLLLRKAAACALPLGQLEAADAGALAWKLHTGGQPAAEAVLKAVLNQASVVYAAAQAELESAGSALSSMAVGFKLEEATSRRSTAAPPSPLVLSGVPQHQVNELSKSLPSLASTLHNRSRSSSSDIESLVRDLALLLGPDAGPGSSLGNQAAAAQRLQVVSHDLPKVLSGPLLGLISLHQQGEGVTNAVAARQQQQLLRALVQALEVELPRMAAAAATSNDSSSRAWSEAGAAAGVSGAAAEGLLELLGEQDTAQLLAAAAARRDDSEREQGLYEMLADVHHDVDMQRYLQMEFDPALELDVVHAPHGWQGADLFVAPADFLDSMKPLLEQYLSAQGEAPVTELEWQVYRDAAIAEHEQVELSAGDARRAAGHSPFNNSRADEAYLTQRLDSSISKDSVLYTAAHKYLRASFKSRGWTFAQRKRLIDRLAEIAGHLQAHPPRMHRGSPFSALFQPDGPPAVPRLSRGDGKPGAPDAAEDSEVYELPVGFRQRL